MNPPVVMLCGSDGEGRTHQGCGGCRRAGKRGASERRGTGTTGMLGLMPYMGLSVLTHRHHLRYLRPDRLGIRRFLLRDACITT